MQIDLNNLMAAALCCLPLAIVIAVMHLQRNRQKKSSPTPFNELRRRPAGETLRCKLEELDDQINDQSSMLVFFPIAMAMGLLVQHPQDWHIRLFFVFLAAVGTSFFAVKTWRLLKTRANHRLGFEGERFVGEELVRLAALGFEIYHDVPFEEGDKGFNIDHVLVGSRGVFVVETKTRRKPVTDDGKKQFRVQFDGTHLHWPWGKDNHGVEQTKNNAKTLDNWLGSATGETVWVTPILTLPGWLVERKTPGDGLFVLNPKEIYQVCAAPPEKLAEPQIRRICHQLDQKSRITVD